MAYVEPEAEPAPAPAVATDKKCSTEKCPHPARCAVRTMRGSGAKRGEMSSTIYYDERTAPKAASPYCKNHGVETVNALAKVLIDNG